MVYACTCGQTFNGVLDLALHVQACRVKPRAVVDAEGTVCLRLKGEARITESPGQLPRIHLDALGTLDLIVADALRFSGTRARDPHNAEHYTALGMLRVTVEVLAPPDPGKHKLY